MPTVLNQPRFIHATTLGAILVACSSLVPPVRAAGPATQPTTEQSAQTDFIRGPELHLRPGWELPPPARPNPPATQPTAPADFTEPPVPPLAPTSPIRTSLANLASPDAAQRDAAATALMGLDRTQLWQLHDLLHDTNGIAPAQAAALHQIVIHDYLATEPYVTDPGGFLGLMSTDYQPIDEPPRLGVPVDELEVGFPSFRMLRRGDLILAVLVDPDAPATQLPNMLTPDFATLQVAISKAGADHEIALDVLRGGQRIRIRLKLAPRPRLSLASPRIFFNERLQQAEAFWQHTFLPLLQQRVS